MLVRSRVTARRSSAAVAVVAAAAVGLSACGGSAAKPRPDLLFVSSRSGVYAIYEMNADGSMQRRVTSGHSGDASTATGLFYEIEPSWSPDGKSIAFASRRGGISDIYVMDAKGKNVRQLTLSVGGMHPTWSPDGKRIAFAGGPVSHLEVIPSAGGTARRITGDTTTERDPAWSPDGRWLAYARTRLDDSTRSDIWLVHPDGSGGHQLSRLDRATYTPAWSPRGDVLAFASDSGGELAIYTIGANGKGLSRIRSSQGGIDPAWSPDGRTIAYSRDGAIITVSSTGANESTLTDPKDNDSSPAWNPVQDTARKGS